VGKVAKSIKVGALTVTAVAPGTYGPGTVGYSASLPLTISKQSVVLSKTVVFAFKGPAGAEVDLGAVSAALPASVVSQVLAAATAKL
jgi:hypothetical protein